jgi:hypothetical protein
MPTKTASTKPGSIASKSKSCAWLCALVLVSACGGKQPESAQHEGQAEALPKPDASSGSITGMSSKPGPGEVPLAGEPPAPVPAVVPEDQVDLLNPETGTLPGGAEAVADGMQSSPPGEPTAQDALAVIRDYYASIESHSYARAYSLWSDGGRASKQTPQQFADGFAETAHVEATLGEAGNEDAGAGQRYLQVPVAITATRTDGSVHRYAGQYTLHRTVVDGATAEQRAWRIASADLREVKP